MIDIETGFKALTKEELQKCLDTLPDDTLYSCQTMANTGNLVVYRGVWPDEEEYGVIDFRHGEITLWGEDND